MADMAINWKTIAALIREGVQTTADAIEKNSKEVEFALTLRSEISFLDQITQWIDILPPERIHSSIFSLLKKIDSDILALARAQRLNPEIFGSTAEQPSPPFIQEAIPAIGPQVAVSADKMKAHITLEPEFVHVWDAEKIAEGINRLGIVGFPLEKGVEAALQNPGKSFKAIQGRPPESGRDALIEDCLGLGLAGIPTIVDRNRANLKDLHWVHNVAQNQVIFKKEPATPGVPGMDVYGNEIPCRDGVDVPFPAIANAVASDDGLTLVSAVDGCAYKEGETLVIVPALEIKKNVGYSTGHIEADVAVNIGGDVLSGFRVESNQDIHVKGTVEAGELSAKGSIFLDSGIQGKSEAVIKAGNRIEAKFINAAQVQAQGELIVHGSIVQSKVRARRVELRDANADIIGGVIEAEEDVCADTFGSDIGVKTVIRLGHDLPEINKKIEEAQERVRQSDEKKQQIQDALEKLDRMKLQAGNLSPDQLKAKVKLLRNQSKIEETLENQRRQLDAAKEALPQAQEMKRTVRARQNVFPGVEIVILDHSFSPPTLTGPITFFVAPDGIKTAPYEERTFANGEEVDE